MTVSPLCEVKNGSDAYVSTANGVDITPGETVIIRLASTADVDQWSIACITTDDSSDAGVVTAALSIDSDAKTATLTAPVPGKTYRFRSTVNGGLDANGVARASFSTTFALYTLLNGRRLVAFDETTEGSAFGWTVWQNDLLRSMPSGVASGTWSSAFAGGGGGGGDFQLFAGNNHFISYQGGSAVGATGLNHIPTTGVVEVSRGLRVVGTAIATLANAMLVAGTGATGFQLVAPKMLRGAIVGATMTYTGVAAAAVGDARHQSFAQMASAHTSNATVTPIFAWKVKDEAITSVFAEVNAVPSGGAAGGSYGRRLRIWANGGVATCGSLSSSWSDEVTASGVGFTGISVGSGIVIGVSGMTGFVNVKGSATGQIDWGATISRTETSWA